jgi:hypothetical protein
MNLLREIRKNKRINVYTKIKLLLLFGIILIVETYAWFSFDNVVKNKGIENEVLSWDVAYVVNEEEILDESVTFNMENIAPGTNYINNFTHIYNTGKENTKIEFEIEKLTIFGDEINIDQFIQGERINWSNDGRILTLFSEDKEYPFIIKCELDRNELTSKYANGVYINGKYEDQKDEKGKYGYENGSDSVATFTVTLEWNYDDKDGLDTEIGKKAYEYYQSETDESETKESAISMIVKLTSSIK